MNSTWLAFLTLLLVVLIAVAAGAQQVEAQKALEISALKARVDEVTEIALDMQEQRDEALVTSDELIVKMDKLNAEIAGLRNDLHNQNNVADYRQQEMDRLVKENEELRAQLHNLQARNGELEAQVANQPQGTIPVTADDANELCLPVQTQNLPGQLGLGLAVLVGVAALGSGGYLYFHHDPNRKYPVKMTKEQIKEYARYQRERGNQAG